MGERLGGIEPEKVNLLLHESLELAHAAGPRVRAAVLLLDAVEERKRDVQRHVRVRRAHEAHAILDCAGAGAGRGSERM